MRSILVTGGTGFFARGFVRRALELGAERVCILSRGEYAQAQMRQEFGDDQRLRFLIGDVRDEERLRMAMQGVDSVVHAAALKRIEVAHYNVMEAVATNVLGTRNVVAAAIAAKVRRAVLLSTDKACNPTTTYGKTKATAEDIFRGAQHYAGASGPCFTVCRYGNVAGSTGSVIPTWRAQRGRTVNVTDPEATRFYMTLTEAVELVVQALQRGRTGDLVLPHELPAYRVGDLAAAMDMDFRVVGLAPNEKLHEEMSPGWTSDKARRMSVDELREALNHV